MQYYTESVLQHVDHFKQKTMFKKNVRKKLIVFGKETKKRCDFGQKRCEIGLSPPPTMLTTCSHLKVSKNTQMNMQYYTESVLQHVDHFKQKTMFKKNVRKKLIVFGKEGDPFAENSTKIINLIFEPFLYIIAYLKTYILSTLHTYILAYQHTFTLSYLHACIFVYLPTCMFAYLYTCIFIYLNIYQSLNLSPNFIFNCCVL